MAGKIPRDFIDELLNRVDIVDVVGRRVPLKKAGREFQACCPFHTEKTPSFYVSPQKQFYHCFGCGAHGSAIGFLMEYERLEFPDAVEELAGLAGLEVPREGLPPQQRHDDLYPILEQAESFFRGELRHHPEAPRAVAYLKRRGLSGEIVAEFGLGYAPPGWDGLRQALAADSQARARAERAGLLISQDGKCYDRFRDRIMFPIRDRRGRTIAFGGRLLGDGKPKYMNSPETTLFHKGRELYGLYEARKALREIRRLLVVEGYMDVLALAQFGIRYAVATLGTATTADHLERLFRVTPEVVFCFDGDRAGRDAAWKALQNALPLAREGREIRFLFLPDGEDPDSLIRRLGPDDFGSRVEQARPLSEFLFEHLGEDLDSRTIDGRAHLAQRAQPLLEQLPEGLYREMMFDQLARLTGITPRGRGRPHRATAPAPRRTPGRHNPVRSAIQLLVVHPEAAARCDDLATDWQRLELPGIAVLTELYDGLRARPASTGAIIEQWRDRPEGAHLARLAAQAPELPDPAEELRGLLRVLAAKAQELNGQNPISLKSPSAMSAEEKEAFRRWVESRSGHT